MFYQATLLTELQRVAWRSAFVVTLLCATCVSVSARGDVLRILSGNQEAAQARVDLIQHAQFEIDAAYFGVSDDELSLTFMALLRDAARRGVKVRLIVDGLRNELPRGLQAYLLHEGVEIREYHPVLSQPLAINRRMHDKVLVADGSQMIVGGRNLNCRNFGLARRNYVDIDVYVRGAAAAQAYHYFQGLWSSDEVRPVRLSALPWPAIGTFAPGDADTTLNNAVSCLSAKGLVRTDSYCEWSSGQPELADVRFLCDDRGCKCRGAISEQILQCFANAQHSIIIESPYLVLSPALEATLTHAQSRGVRVVILTNSLASTDHVVVYGGYANQKLKLLACGIELWEFAGPDHLHAKAAVIDGYISIIGSSNFDPRSEHLNTETAIIACDPNFADCLIQSMAAHFAGAWPIGTDGRPAGADCAHPGANKTKRFQMGAARLLAPLIERQL